MPALATVAALATVLVLCVALVRKLVARRNSRDLRGAHVWLLGASQGLGRSLAHALARAGCTVSVSSRRVDALEALRCELGGRGGAAVALDVTGAVESLADALGSVEKRCGKPVDVVVCNAGVNNGNAPLAALDFATLDRVLDTNLRAPLRLARLCHARLAARRGAFVAVSSLAGYRGLPGASVYGASKAGLTALCESLAIEWAGDQVDVVCVHPGFIDTPAIRALDHPKPLLVSEDDAAALVVTAIRERTRHAAFPWLMEHVVMRFSRMVPTPLYNFIMARVG